MNFIRFSTLFTAIIALGLASCKKDSLVGNDIQPGKPGVNTIDTLTVVSETLKGDTFASNNVSNNYLGFINDPLFGKTKASIFSQFLKPSDAVSFQGAIADSIILYLPYKSYYGDITTPQRVQVYQLTSALPSTRTTSDYSENGRIDSTNILADHSFLPRPADSISVLGTKMRALRIALDPAILGPRFSAASSTDLTPSGWLNYFKGLFIRSVDPGLTTLKGSELNFDLENSRIIYYYKRSRVGNTLPRPNQYVFSSAGGIHINQVKHSQTGSRVGAEIGTQLQDSLYILGMGGEKIKVTFPHLAEIKKLSPTGRITINKAELKFTQIPTGRPTFTESTELSAYVLNSDNSSGVAITQALRNQNAYTVDITKHLQQAYNGTKEKGIVLKLTADEISAQRMMLSGTNNIKLVLTFTNL